ncbi:MAG: DNA polymerase III subunit gamma/tau [Chloroflexi bacterium]|nr:DNA polymerase III subunit gamma/tau [Chloroflexota bacterium]MQC27291.1 DNA polymerase III subunit gamma/tau [Chloroflexota bacterium]
MSQALYRKWRPSTWSDVIGQAHVIETLRNAVSAERVGHAYLFSGPRGTGKTSVARLLAKALNCTHADPVQRPDDTCENCLAVQNGSFLDLIEIDAASNTSVEDVRELRDKINFSPNLGRYKVYIIDEVHMLSTAAFNALLKTLEEPPPHAIFILATTEVHKIPATVLSRCQRHEFRRIPVAEISAHLKEMAKAEKIAVEDQALELIARQATGSMRDAQSLLDQLSSLGESITLNWAQEVLGAATSQSVLELLDAIIAREPAVGLATIHRALDSGSDPRQFARQTVDYLRGVLMHRMGADLGPELGVEETQHMQRHAASFSVHDLLRVIRLFNHAASDAKAAWQPSLPLEMAFVEALESDEAQAASQSPPKTTPANVPPANAPPAQKPPGQKPQSPQSSSQSAAPKQPPAKPPAQQSSTSLDNAQWERIKEEIRQQNPTLHALLNSCRLREVRGQQLYLGFASELLKEKMEKQENLDLFSNALEKVLGDRMAVSCFVSSTKGDQLPAGVDSSSMVAAALRLGAEIVDQNDLGKSADPGAQ